MKLTLFGQSWALQRPSNKVFARTFKDSLPGALDKLRYFKAYQQDRFWILSKTVSTRWHVTMESFYASQSSDKNHSLCFHMRPGLHPTPHDPRPHDTRRWLRECQRDGRKRSAVVPRLPNRTSEWCGWPYDVPWRTNSNFPSNHVESLSIVLFLTLLMLSHIQSKLSYGNVKCGLSILKIQSSMAGNVPLLNRLRIPDENILHDCRFSK